MNDEQLTEHSQNIRKQAESLLNSTNLLGILNKFGNVHLVGSYPLDIMYGPDIDIIVEAENIRESSLHALHEVLKERLFPKIEYGDFVKFPMKERPKGYILVLKSLIQGVKWEIEVWFLEDAIQQLDYHKYLRSNITEQTRLEILKAKHQRDTSNISKYKRSSFQIYEQILGRWTD